MQVKEAAAEAGVEMGGENALPCFSPQHIDLAGLDRIVYNTQAWAPPLQVTPPLPGTPITHLPWYQISCVRCLVKDCWRQNNGNWMGYYARCCL